MKFARKSSDTYMLKESRSRDEEEENGKYFSEVMRALDNSPTSPLSPAHTHTPTHTDKQTHAPSLSHSQSQPIYSSETRVQILNSTNSYSNSNSNSNSYTSPSPTTTSATIAVTLNTTPTVLKNINSSAIALLKGEDDYTMLCTSNSSSSTSSRNSVTGEWLNTSSRHDHCFEREREREREREGEGEDMEASVTDRDSKILATIAGLMVSTSTYSH